MAEGAPLNGQLYGELYGQGRRRAAAVLLCALLPLGAASVALGHHSYTTFDDENQVKLSGTVQSFMWSNPHVYIGLAVMEPRGTVNTYMVECASPVILERLGWQVDMLKPGDPVTIIMAPLKSGDPGGLLKQLIMPDGRRFSDGPLAGAPNIE